MQKAMLLVLMLVLCAASVSALNITRGTITLHVGEGFNFSQLNVIPEKNDTPTDVDIMYHEYKQTSERGMKITRGNPLGALTDRKNHIHFTEINLLKSTGQVEDCISKEYFYQAGIAPTLGRSYCVVLDRKDEIHDFTNRRLAWLHVIKLTKDSVTLDWGYVDTTNDVTVEEEPTLTKKEEPNVESGKNFTVTPPTISEAPPLAKKILKKHNWKPWLIGWVIVLVLVVGYEVVRGFGRRK
ncbi:MAG: hypothetical protein Q7R76_05935 [Candidatus Woesearchaeota archaeon]|nr:hypothetical protein [Candidatus Woesearchaeota archaeon]